MRQKSLSPGVSAQFQAYHGQTDGGTLKTWMRSNCKNKALQGVFIFWVWYYIPSELKRCKQALNRCLNRRKKYPPIMAGKIYFLFAENKIIKGKKNSINIIFSFSPDVSAFVCVVCNVIRDKNTSWIKKQNERRNGKKQKHENFFQASARF